MLSVIVLVVIMLSIIVLGVIMLSVAASTIRSFDNKDEYAECQCAGCHYTEYHCAGRHYTEC